jgi:hypothetical protein
MWWWDTLLYCLFVRIVCAVEGTSLHIIRVKNMDYHVLDDPMETR